MQFKTSNWHTTARNLQDSGFDEAAKTFDEHIELEYLREIRRRVDNARQPPYKPPAAPAVSFPQNAVYIDTLGPDGPQIVGWACSNCEPSYRFQWWLVAVVGAVILFVRWWR